MRAPNGDLRNRGVAVLASGVVVAMTAFSVGLVPASADPDDGPGAPTTTVVVPEPEAAAPETTQAREKPSAVEEAPVASSTSVAPSAPVAPSTSAAEQTPQTQTPQTEAPQTQTPETLVPETQAPKPPTTTATRVAPPATSEPETSTAPPAPSPALAPATTTGSSPAERPTSSSSSSKSSTDPAAPAESSEAAPKSSAAASTSTSAADETTTESEAADESRQEQTTSTSVTQAATEIEPVVPETVEAPAQDVKIAKAAKVVEQPEPAPAEVAEVAAIARIIDVPILNRDRRGDDVLRVNDDVRLASAWDRNVRQWSLDWVEYDDYYRPVFANPYREAVKIIYMYQNAPRILMIPPLSRIVLEVAQYAAYSFTAVVMGAVNTAVNVAVGSFFGGGFFPGIGLPLPPPPPPLLRYDNVPVSVNYSQQRYEPFRVQRIIDVGPDARYGERKVLLDGVTPAWGKWTQSPAGERQFEVHRTQQFPGLTEPGEAPLPGDYELRLASDESASSGFNGRDAYLMAAAILCALLSAGAVMLSVHIGRRRDA